MFQFVTDKVCMKVAMKHRRFWCATPADRSVASFRRSVALRSSSTWGVRAVLQSSLNREKTINLTHFQTLSVTDHECRTGQDFVRDSVSCCCTHRCSELVCWGSRSWDRCYPGELELMVGGGWCSVNEMQEYASVCQSMQEYANVCQSMPESCQVLPLYSIIAFI